ncbi:MAG: DNA polymerase III subunit delta' [Halofilum sp. (in: g-proteobacteria)]
MTAAPLPPWQEESWARVCRLHDTGRLPHALLISGPGGTGEGLFADTLMQALLCTAATATAPCGDCNACREYAAGTHPDAVRVDPEESGKAIGIDRIRELTGRLNLTSGGRAKVARIEPAESMTLAAANSLLKTLEEPPGDSILLLVSERPARLPATVRSRCQRITFGLPPRDLALAWLHDREAIADPEHWLDRAGGAPLRALAMAEAAFDETPLVAALVQALGEGRIDRASLDAGNAVPLAQSIAVLAAAVEDMIRLRLASDPPLRMPMERQRLSGTAAKVDVRALFDYLDELRRSVPGPSSALRADIQWHGLLADAAETGRNRHN